MKTNRIKLGKTYKTDNGYDVRIVAFINDAMPYVGVVRTPYGDYVKQYNRKGQQSNYSASTYDIIFN